MGQRVARRIETDEERAERGSRMARAHFENGGEFESVSHKDEGGSERDPFGPMVMLAKGVTSARRPVGGPDPEGVFYMGWRRRSEARAIAAEVGMALREH